VKRFNLEKVQAEIDWTRDKPISYIYIADANFGMYKERDLEIARMLKNATDDSSVDLISVQNAKQSTEIAFEIGKVLGEKYAGVSIAMQSLNESTLEAINRKNLSTNNTKELLELSVKYQIPTYTEMILGMPNETLDSWCKGMSDLLEFGQHNSIEMWFTQLLENSELSQPNSRFTYNIKSIISKNYISLKNPTDWNDPDEETELICSTNTMSTEDMIEAYMYGWMIIQIHVTGYSQIISKYLRFARNLSYYDFYNNLISDIKQSDFFNPHYEYVRDLVKNFLNTGIVKDEATGHMLHSVSNPWLYENKTTVIDFIYDSAKKIHEIPNWVKELQHNFIYDSEKEYPIIIVGNYNIIEKIESETHYKITSKLSNKIRTFSSANMRRRGLLKNTIYIFKGQ
jgi:putative methyltransferase